MAWHGFLGTVLDDIRCGGCAAVIGGGQQRVAEVPVRTLNRGLDPAILVCTRQRAKAAVVRGGRQKDFVDDVALRQWWED